MIPFEIASGSVPGRDHVAVLKNNQDATTFYHGEDFLVAVVCDGCGSGKFSEAGALVGAQVLCAAIVSSFKSFPFGNTFPPEPNAAAEMERALKWVLSNAQRDTLNILENTAKSMSRERSCLFAAIIEHYFLFTVVGTIVTPTKTVVFHLGDGIYSINNEVTILEPRAGNAPVYLGYNLVETTLKDTEPDALKLQTHFLSTPDLETLILGSDGCERINERQTDLLPGSGTEYVGNLSQFSAPKMFENSDNVRRRLALINKTGQKVDWEKKQILKYNGVLNDDTTLVTIRRSPTLVLPSLPEQARDLGNPLYQEIMQERVEVAAAAPQ